MAHFAQLDEANIVTNVIVVHNNELLEDGQESEQKGIEFCKMLFGQDTNWVQTSYNGNFRKRYAGAGYMYDAEKDAFIAPKPYPSWTLDENCEWVAPIVRPVDGMWAWNEEMLRWDEVTSPA